MSDLVELKPCPFCGGRFVAQGASREFISVWCGCGAQGPSVPFPETCIDPVTPIRKCYELWNRRSPDPELSRLSALVAWQDIETAPRDGTPIIDELATLRADNERLGRERDADIDALHGTFSKPIAVLQERVAAAEAERDTLLAQVAKMRGALEPFAAAAEHFDCHVKDGDVVPISLRHIRARHVFAARAALTKEPS